MSAKRKRERPKPPGAPISQDIIRSLLKHRRERPSVAKLLSQDLSGASPYLEESDEPFTQLLRERISTTPLESGFSANRPPADSLKALREAAPGALTVYQQLIPTEIDSLRAILRTLDPSVTLAWLSHRNNFRPWGTFYEPQDEYLGQCIVVASHLLLERPQRPHPRRFPNVQELYDLIVRLLRLRDMGVIIEMARGFCEEPRKGFDPRRYLRESWLLMSESNYRRHADEVARELYGTREEWLVDQLGFTLNDLLLTREAIFTVIQDSVLAAITQAASPFAEASEYDLEIHMQIEQNLLSLLPDAMSFDADKLIQQAPNLRSDRVRAIIDVFSRDILQGSEVFSSLFTESPLVGSPFLRDGQRCFVPDFDRVAGYIVPLIEPHLRDKKRFSKHRANTVDRLTIDCLCRMLPGAEAYQHVFYAYKEGDGKHEAELDALVLFDEVAFIVEGKASKLSPQSRRGDLERLRRDLSRSIGEAWLQGKRARDYIRSSDVASFKNERGETVVAVDSARVSKSYVVMPTLYSMGDFATNLGVVREWELVPEGEAPWTVSLTDLMIVRDTISHPEELVGYLEWRQRVLEDENVFFPDEVELFGAYLYGWMRPRDVPDDSFVLVSGLQGDFDDWYMYLEGEAPRAEQPRKQTTPLVRRFREKLERQRPPGWLLASAYCLTSPVAMMRVVEEQLRKDWWNLPPRAMTAKFSEPYALILLGRDVSLSDFWERSSSLYLPDNVQWIWIIRVNKGQSELLWVMPSEHIAERRAQP
jgi:hypothetical protein